MENTKYDYKHLQILIHSIPKIPTKLAVAMTIASLFFVI